MVNRSKQILVSVSLLSVSFFFLFWPTDSFASPSDSLRLNLDYSVFKYLPDTDKSYLEIYYSLEQKELDYIQQVEGFGTIVSLELSLKDQEGKEVKEKKWKVGSLVQDAEKVKTSDAQMIDILGDTIKPGVYSLELKVIDLNSNRAGMKKTKVTVPDFRGESLQMSDIELALNLSEEDTAEVKFNKPGIRVLPNPGDKYILKEGMLYLYAEIYNLQFDQEGEKKGYSLNFSVLDSAGSNPKDYGTQINAKPGNTAVVMNALNISSLAPGEYQLRILARDLDSEKEVKRIKPFKVGTRAVRDITEEPLTEEEAKELRNILSYIGTRDELNMYDQLNLAGKKQFMAEFWRRNDPDPSTPENEFKIEYYRRWEEAKSKYSYNKVEKDGWRADMGRVYIIYGEPDDIERHPYSITSKSWERWNYDHIQGGVYFIFIDDAGFGVYKLIHSTAKGEIKDSRWQERVDTEGASDITDY